MSIIDPKDLDIESRKNLFKRVKDDPIASCLEDRPSGFGDDEPMDFDRFLAAWTQDRAEGSLNGRLIEALKSFVIHFRIEGKGGYDVEVPVRMRNPRNPTEEREIAVTCQTEKLPDITYNPDGLKDIRDFVMPYRMWMDAVADLKFNLSGSSHGEEATRYEDLHWGGPVDMTQDVDVPGLDPEDPIDKVFDL